MESPPGRSGWAAKGNTFEDGSNTKERLREGGREGGRQGRRERGREGGRNGVKYNRLYRHGIQCTVENRTVFSFPLLLPLSLSLTRGPADMALEGSPPPLARSAQPAVARAEQGRGTHPPPPCLSQPPGLAAGAGSGLGIDPPQPSP